MISTTRVSQPASIPQTNNPYTDPVQRQKMKDDFDMFVNSQQFTFIESGNPQRQPHSFTDSSPSEFNVRALLNEHRFGPSPETFPESFMDKPLRPTPPDLPDFIKIRAEQGRKLMEKHAREQQNPAEIIHLKGEFYYHATIAHTLEYYRAQTAGKNHEESLKAAHEAAAPFMDALEKALIPYQRRLVLKA